ncbi:MAG: endonuclease/exonuclease/phosphatase family protein [Alphaproteobacteria bacterium]|nr:endonuclease/exonuclease/phosphatase family protein [Alphaproteobacteria bacterium]
MTTFLALRLIAKGFLGAVIAGLGLLSIAGFAGRHWWLLDIASHFRVQYLIVSVALALLVLPARWYRHAALLAAIGVLNGALILPLYLAPAEPPAGSAPALRAMLINLRASNRDHAAVLRSIRAYDPDFVVVEEVTARWETALRALMNEYPYAIIRARTDNHGIALYSKRPFADHEIVMLSAAAVPSVLAEFDLDGRNFFVLATHALPPTSSNLARHRREHLAGIPALLRQLDAPVLLLGDLNASPWSYPFRRLLEQTKLRDGSRGRGFQPTWPTAMWPLLIPLDHCLYSAGISILDKIVGPHLGSDHYPVIVDFMVP